LKKKGIFEETLIMVTADHGGYGSDHGAFNQANTYIPGIFVGPGI
jgi:hypothetical protein